MYAYHTHMAEQPSPASKSARDLLRFTDTGTRAEVANPVKPAHGPAPQAVVEKCDEFRTVTFHVPSLTSFIPSATPQPHVGDLMQFDSFYDAE